MTEHNRRSEDGQGWLLRHTEAIVTVIISLLGFAVCYGAITTKISAFEKTAEKVQVHEVEIAVLKQIAAGIPDMQKKIEDIWRRNR